LGSETYCWGGGQVGHIFKEGTERKKTGIVKKKSDEITGEICLPIHVAKITNIPAVYIFIYL
jgi:hypothetical protein